MRTALLALLLSSSAFAQYYTVKDEDAGMTRRSVINFTGAGVACVDTATPAQTTCTIAGSAGSNWNVTGSDLYRNSKVTIGSTTAPALSLDVYGAGASMVGYLRNTNASGYAGLGLVNSAGSERASIGFGNASAGVANLQGKAFVSLDNTAGFAVSRGAGTQLIDIPVGTDLVGIGRTPGTYKLEVEGSLAIMNAGSVSSLYLNDANTIIGRAGNGYGMAGPIMVFYKANAAGTGWVFLNDTTGGTKSLVVTADNGGRLGVGDVVPTEKLEANGVIYSNTGGFKFPDGVTQANAAVGYAITLAGGTATQAVRNGAKCVCSSATANPMYCSVAGTTLTVNGTGTDTGTALCL